MDNKWHTSLMHIINEHIKHYNSNYSIFFTILSICAINDFRKWMYQSMPHTKIHIGEEFAYGWEISFCPVDDWWRQIAYGKNVAHAFEPFADVTKNVYKYTYSEKWREKQMSYFNSISVIASLCLDFLDVATLAFQNERKLVRLPLKFLKSPFL